MTGGLHASPCPRHGCVCSHLAVVQRKLGALRNGAPFLEMPEAFRQLQAGLLKRPGGDREMIEILSLVLHHDEQAVLRAVELALEDGVATKTHVLNVLHRLIDGKAPPASPIDAPQALRLGKEPKADVGRYDTLREMRACQYLGVMIPPAPRSSLAWS